MGSGTDRSSSAEAPKGTKPNGNGGAGPPAGAGAGWATSAGEGPGQAPAAPNGGTVPQGATGAGAGTGTGDGLGLGDSVPAPEADLASLLVGVEHQRDEYLEALRRLQAEFDNYRKRVAKQQAEEADRRAARLVVELLPVLDALDLAASHLGEPPSDDGRALVASAALLNDVLRKEGLERIDPVGEEFDPTAHEAVGHLPAEEGGAAEEAEEAGEPGPAGAGGDGPDGPTGPDAPSGTEAGTAPGAPTTVVAQVMRAGYRYRGTVVRPAMVLVRG